MKLNFDYTFKNYLIGNNNKAARKVIVSAMTLPGQIYNPIFIYGIIAEADYCFCRQTTQGDLQNR